MNFNTMISIKEKSQHRNTGLNLTAENWITYEIVESSPPLQVSKYYLFHLAPS